MGFDPEQKRGQPTNKGSWVAGENSDPESALPTPNPYADSTPAECDNKLAQLWVYRSNIIKQRQGVQQRLDNHFEDEEHFSAHGKTVLMWDRRMTPENLTDAENLVEALDSRENELIVEMNPIDEEYERRGKWTRFYLVRGANGHVHSSTDCHSCYPSTEFVWLPDFSGSDETETVELAGDGACSFCFPSAPTVNPSTPRPNQLETADVLQARADKAVLQAKKEAKAKASGIWNPDGTELREAPTLGRSGQGALIKTERTAEITAVDCALLTLEMAWRDENREPGEPARTLSPWHIQRADTLAAIIPALAAKRELTVEEVEKAIWAKAQKKFDKDYK